MKVGLGECCDDEDIECHVCHDGDEISDEDYEIVYRDQHTDYKGYPCDKGRKV